MAAIIDRESLADFVQSEATLIGESGSNEDATNRAVAVGNNDVLAALRRSGRYDSDALDALTVEEAPAVLAGIACAIARDELTGGNAGRSELIGTIAAQARAKLSLIATGNYLVDGIDVAESATSGVRYHRNKERVFDRCNTSQKFNVRDEEI